MKCSVCGHDNSSAARFCSNCGATLTAVTRQVVTKEPEQIQAQEVAEYAGFWVRFLAAIIDWVILSLLSFILTAFPIAFTFRTFFTFFISFPIVWLYHWLFIGLKGQTPGKMALGLKVININYQKPGLGIAALREILGKTISTVVLFIGFLWIGGDTKKQGWHDMIAGTYVVKVEK